MRYYLAWPLCSLLWFSFPRTPATTLPQYTGFYLSYFLILLQHKLGEDMGFPLRFLLHLLLFVVGLHTCVMAPRKRSEDTLWKSVPSSYSVRACVPGKRTLVTRLALPTEPSCHTVFTYCYLCLQEKERCPAHHRYSIDTQEGQG